jgi:tRNA G26 N,N-dimethylase Trm1
VNNKKMNFAVCKKKVCYIKSRNLDKPSDQITTRIAKKDTLCSQCGNKIECIRPIHVCKFCNDDFCKSCVAQS